MDPNEKNKLRPLYAAFEWTTFAAILVTAALLCLRWNDLPNVIATHYNAAGEVDLWGRRLTALAPLGLQFFLWVMISLALRYPAEWAVPVRVKRENLIVVRATMTMAVLSLRLVLTLLLMWIELSIVFLRPLGGLFTMVSFVAIGGILVVSIIYLYRAFRNQTE